MEMETKDDFLKSQIAIRCAKAAVLLSCLKTSQNCNLRATIDYGNEEREILKRAITDLKIELVKERRKIKRIKVCGLVELVIVLSLCSFCLILAIKY
ncbi:hypothetical protein VitviT2T_027204 [Vitis vinifera]|uniref:Uncharacterized protein n=1 Tax=Vitis vinifera TaxID=29760 RepID=A0ABY9DR96_VITVI|nr:hypothetical protein VitviT2T_027204 [Vitis vinifera]